MENTFITVFTPTYNRAYTLGRLYDSLKRQTDKNFEWLIVDDGSTDNTKTLVKKFQNEGILSIRYFYQENAGKMQAHNRGVAECSSELFVCVDSDDYLVDTAVEQLRKVWAGEENHDYSGIAAYRGSDENTNLGKGEFPRTHHCTMGQLSSEGFQGDTTLCFNTAVLKQFAFPYIPGEKFLSESFLYDQIDRKYQCLVYPKILTICKYLADGYTNNMAAISFRNPVGRMYHEAQNMQWAESFPEKVKAAIRYDAYKVISHHRDIRKFSFAEQMLKILMYPAGIILAEKKRRQVKKCL